MTRLPRAFLDRPIAHRGLHDAAAGIAENSLSAIRAAVSAGYGAEIDVQISADGEAMVFHDDRLDRLTAETGPVRDRDAAALGAMRLAGGDDAIPTFAEALEEVAGRAPLLVEIKRQAPEIGVGPLEARVAALLGGRPGPVAVMSFDPASVAWFRDRAPEIPRGIVAMDFLRDAEEADLTEAERRALTDIAAFEALAADFVSHDWRRLPTPRTRALRAAGVPVLCWTVRREADHRAALAHADNVTFEGYRPPAP